MSDASRNTFETVITETPARSAMSFKRTIASFLDHSPKDDPSLLHPANRFSFNSRKLVRKTPSFSWLRPPRKIERRHSPTHLGTILEPFQFSFFRSVSKNVCPANRTSRME